MIVGRGCCVASGLAEMRLGLPQVVVAIAVMDNLARRDGVSVRNLLTISLLRQPSHFIHIVGQPSHFIHIVSLVEVVRVQRVDSLGDEALVDRARADP